jgi:pyruvate, water dikinase
MNKQNIVWFKDLTSLDEKIVGQKATRIAELSNARIPIPRGFVITNTEYFDFLQKNDLKQKINDVLKTINFKDPLDIKEKTDAIKHMIYLGKITQEFKTELSKAYFKLGEKSIGWLNSKNDEYVAIRSSIITEEKNKKYAKIIEEEGGNLNIKTIDLIVANVKDCWASLFSQESLLLIKEKELNIDSFSVAVIIQLMIPAKTSGIMLTSKNQLERETCIVEAVFGFGGRLILKEITPDHYEVSKKLCNLITKKQEKQEWHYIRLVGVTKKQELSKKEQEQEKLDKLALKDLAILAKKIESYFGTPQKVEWVIKKKDIYILNSEPMFENNINIKQQECQQKISEFKSNVLLRGVCASKGVVNGIAVIINNNSDLLKINKDSIIVTRMTTPEMIEYIKKAKAVVTDAGSAICHAAVVCQKLNKPCVVNTKTATTDIITGATIQVNGSKGEVSSIDGVKLVKVNYNVEYKKDEDLIEKKEIQKKKVLYLNVCYEDINNIESIEFPINKLFTEKETQEFKNIEKKDLIDIIKTRIKEKIDEI